jgi:hypothetical protein
MTARRTVLPQWLWPLLLPALLALRLAAAARSTVPLRSGADLPLLLADSSVVVMEVARNLTLAESDWRGVATPLTLNRSVVIRGVGPTTPVIDMGFVSAKASSSRCTVGNRVWAYWLFMQPINLEFGFLCNLTGTDRVIRLICA